jgi:3-hydroxyisobutyrate dehydrogenase-like beta-hydroxyacid dehydrogenase
VTATSDVGTYGASPVDPPLASRRIAVVGTGRMGAAMAGQLSSAGADLVLWNRSRERAERLASSLSARVVGDARDAAADSEVVVVSLADDAAARFAYENDAGLIAGVHDGLVVLDTSTVDPETTRALAPPVAERGGTLLDAPLSGSVATAQQGTLTFMVGGPAEALGRVGDVLDVLGAATFHMGETGTGATTKLIVNSVLLGLNQALAEGLVLAEQAGVDPERAYDVLAAGAVGAPFVHYKRDAFLRPDETAVAFSLSLVAKDLALATELAQRVGVEAHQLQVNLQRAEQAVARGHGDRDLASIARVLRNPR